jgi:hypothetical protein
VGAKPIDISPSIFETEKEKIDNELIFYCGHVVSELRDFYPDEYFMLELLSSGQLVDFMELSEGQSYIRHLMNYGIVGKNNGIYCTIIPVVSQYVGLELARKEKRQLVYKIIPEANRTAWLARRVEEIITDLRVLERVITKCGNAILFGTSSFPEADRFKDIRIVKSKDDFIGFINICNRCFVEPIDIYGKSIRERNYFWTTIKSTYEFLFTVFHRIRVYRNESDHLEINNTVNEQYLDFLTQDLEGRSPSQVRDLYFVLQQRILDHLLYNTQIEISRIS